MNLQSENFGPEVAATPQAGGGGPAAAVGPALGWLGVAAVAAIPLAWPWGLPFLPKRDLNLTLFDFLVWAAVFAWFGRLFLRPEARAAERGWLRRWAGVVWPGALLWAVSAASLAAARPLDAKALLLAGKQALQWTEYLLLLPLVALPLVAEARWRRRVCWGLTAGLVVALATVAVRTPLAAVLSGKQLPFFVGGLWGNRHSMGAALAVALCLLVDWGLAKAARPSAEPPADLPWAVLPAVLLPILAFYPLLSAGPAFGALLGLAVVCLRRLPRGGGLLFFFMLFVLAGGAGREKGKLLMESIQSYRPVREASGLTASRPTMRFMRWAAELNLIYRHPWLGVGWGQYQRRLGDYYGDIPYPEGTTDKPELYDLEANEPFTFSWFLVTAGESGLIGLGALFLLLGELAVRAVGRPGRGPCLLAGGVLGAVLALLVAGIFTHPLTRGVGPLVGLLLAVSACPEPPVVGETAA